MPPVQMVVKLESPDGPRKAIQLVAVTHDKEKGTIDLAVSVLVQIAQPGATTPIYKPWGCEVPITDEQRRRIIKALEGPKSDGNGEAGRSGKETETGGNEGKGGASVAPDSLNSRHGGSS